MAKINLAEIEARTEKATAGPWEVCNGIDVFTELGATNNSGVTADFNDGWYISKCNEGSTSTDGEEVELAFAEQNANAEFIAHAREDVPALIKRLRRAEELLVKAHADEIRGHLYKEIERYFEEAD